MDIRRKKPGRDRVAIVAEILEMTRDGELKSNIMWRAGLSYIMLNGYLGLMMNAKLLDRVFRNNKVVFKATNKGMKFLYHCNRIMELLEAEDDGHKPYRRFQLLPSSFTSQSPYHVLTQGSKLSMSETPTKSLSADGVEKTCLP